MLERRLHIADFVEKNKVVVLYGPRQVGKTTLLNQYLLDKNNYILKTGDDIPFSHDFSTCSLDLLRKMIPAHSLLIIDEAQKIPNIGRALKLVIDNIDGVEVIVTGSSSFDLANTTDESLTGRKKVITLYPLSMEELLNNKLSQYDLDKKLEDFMIYGLYPEVYLMTTHNEKVEKVTELANSYLLKDILSFDTIKNSRVMFDLLKLIAFQAGSLVSTTELASQLGVDKKTVARYLDLLEKSFVLYRLNGFSSNLRKEITKMSKYYFYDLGIRNALIANFNAFSDRNDVGMLWENFLLIERIKKNSYLRRPVNYYFWRTYEKQEIDLIEESGGSLAAFEFKYSPSKKSKVPKDWLNSYQSSSFNIINKGNYTEFI